QCAQVTPREFDMKAMTGMSWDVGIPVRTLMFFFVSSTGLSAFTGANADSTTRTAATANHRIFFMQSPLPASNDAPLIRPSGAFSPRGGEKGNFLLPLARAAGRGWPKAGEGCVINA